MKDILLNRALFVLLLITVYVISSSAQQNYEVGEIADLKGKLKLYIDTDGDLKNKGKIERKIKKANVPGLEIIEDAAAADMILSFGGVSRSVVVAGTSVINTSTVVATPVRAKLAVGAGALFAEKDGKLLLIFRYVNEQESQLEDMPATKLAAEFLKYYRQANDLKEK